MCPSHKAVDSRSKPISLTPKKWKTSEMLKSLVDRLNEVVSGGLISCGEIRESL
jgi:hypothetical protein